jgi:hypothetical protein
MADGMVKWREWREWPNSRKNGRMAEWQKWLHTYYPFRHSIAIQPFRHSAIPPFHVLFMVHADADTDDTDDDDDNELHADTNDNDDDNDDNDDNNNIAISAILPFCHFFCRSAIHRLSSPSRTSFPSKIGYYRLPKVDL